jgi:hypothetical protein
MCLALYANGMLRLWNMLDARCIFKKKVGIEENESDNDDDDDDDEDNESREDLNRPIA